MKTIGYNGVHYLICGPRSLFWPPVLSKTYRKHRQAREFPWKKGQKTVGLFHGKPPSKMDDN